MGRSISILISKSWTANGSSDICLSITLGLLAFVCNIKIRTKLEMLLTTKKTTTKNMSPHPCHSHIESLPELIVYHHCRTVRRGVQGVRTLFWENYLWSACPLIMLYISISFHEHILNVFQLIQGKQNYYCQTSKENSSKKYIEKSYTAWCAHHLMMLYISVKFHENILKGFLLIQLQLHLLNFKGE